MSLIKQSVLATIFLSVAMPITAGVIDYNINADKRKAACDDLTHFLDTHLLRKSGSELAEGFRFVSREIFERGGSASFKVFSGSAVDVLNALSERQDIEQSLQIHYSIGSNQWDPSSAPIFNQFNPWRVFRFGSCEGTYSSQTHAIPIQELEIINGS